mmetsp:Transcript_12160/g.21985  ORF Transcript_12160/g.21985 Transcript_12160/m.21985 type:complete len:221 (-) Transcript_12160:1727-2389(-)
MSTTLCEDSIHITHGILGHRDITQVDRLEDVGLSSQHGRKADTTRSRHDLSHTTVDGISMKYNIHKVEPGSTQLLFTEGSVLGSPSETTNNRFLNFSKVVNTLCGVNEKVGASSVRSKGPNLTGLRNIPSELIRKLTSLGLGLSTCKDLTIINGGTKLGTKSFSLNKETIVLVGRLGKTGLVRLAITGLTEGHNGIRDLDLSSHEILLKILETDLKMQLS